MYCHDQKVIGSNPCQVNLEVHSTSVKVVCKPEKSIILHALRNQPYLSLKEPVTAIDALQHFETG